MPETAPAVAVPPPLKELSLLDTIPLRDAYRALLDAAATVADAGRPGLPAPPGEWDADQILAHIALIGAATIAAVSALTAGANTTYDNRIAQDTWTIDRVIGLAGGNTGLRDRIGRQADALCALAGGPALSEAELAAMVSTRLLSHDTLLLDQPMPLRDILSGLADMELPGHTRQLLALLPDSARAGAAT